MNAICPFLHHFARYGNPHRKRIQRRVKRPHGDVLCTATREARLICPRQQSAVAELLRLLPIIQTRICATRQPPPLGQNLVDQPIKRRVMGINTLV